MERASGSVRETCPSGASRSRCSIDLRSCICCLSLAILSLSLGFGNVGLGSIGGVHGRQIAVDTLFDLLHARAHLATGEVAVAVVDRLELAAVDGDDRLREQVEPAAQLDEPAAHVADRLAVV